MYKHQRRKINLDLVVTLQAFPIQLPLSRGQNYNTISDHTAIKFNLTHEVQNHQENDILGRL